MPEPTPLNLNGQEVQCLKATGCVDICRPLKGETNPGQLPAFGLHPAGEVYWVRERVARRHKDDPPGQHLYRADGYVEGRIYLASYYMPFVACRFYVQVEGEQLDFVGEGESAAWMSTARLRVVPPPATAPEYTLDFDTIRLHSGGRNKPIFPVAELLKATDPAAEHDDLVRLHAYQGFGEWRLPLTNFDVRQWLKSLRFREPPQLRFGDALVPCGKEEPAL